MKISIVTPVYKGEACIEELYTRAKREIVKLALDLEIIFVNDSSPDNSWQVIKKICAKDKKAIGINLSRNFGQHFAITAGLDYTSGDFIVVMDCDLQDKPEEIKKLYNYLVKNNLDYVFGRRVAREDSLLKRLSSKLFYKVYNYFADSKFDDSVANFSISKRRVIENFRRLGEHNRSFPLFIKWMGFKSGFVDVSHSKRLKGKSSYNLSKLINLAIDSIVSQSNKPLLLSIKLGFALALLSIIYAVYLMVMFLFNDISVQGWTSLMVSIFFLSGLLLVNMGVIGLYIGKIFNETKNRPLYIVSESINLKSAKRNDI